MYFPDSPVNILSETALDEYMKYHERTGVLPKYFIFVSWEVQKDNISLWKLYTRIRDPGWLSQVFWIFTESGLNFKVFHIYIFLSIHIHKGGTKKSQDNGS